MEMILRFNKIFLSGIEMLFNPRRVYFDRINDILKTSDEEALYSDWKKTGNDMKKAISIYEENKKS